jgi:hypothetical protein
MKIKKPNKTQKIVLLLRQKLSILKQSAMLRREAFKIEKEIKQLLGE